MVSKETSRILRTLLLERKVAGLGTLQDGEPYVSMVPFALEPGSKGIVIHASDLAAHTRNMRRDTRVSVLVSEPETPDKAAQSLARVTIQGTAREIGREEEDYRHCRAAYLARFPDSAPMFDFADFSLFLIEVTSARLVAGFAQATTLDAARFAAAAQPGG